MQKIFSCSVTTFNAHHEPFSPLLFTPGIYGSQSVPQLIYYLSSDFSLRIRKSQNAPSLVRLVERSLSNTEATAENPATC